MPAIRPAIRSAIRSAIRGATEAISRWYSVHNNLEAWEFDTWFPAGPEFTYKVKTTFDAASIGSGKQILIDPVSGQPRLRKRSNQQIRFQYPIDGVGGTNNLTSSTMYEVDKVIDIEVVSTASGITLIINGVVEASSVTLFFEPATRAGIGRVGADDVGDERYIGTIFDLELIDAADASNNRFYPVDESDGDLALNALANDAFSNRGTFLQGDGSTIYIDASIPVTSGDTQTFDYKPSNQLANQRLVSVTGNLAALLHTSTETLTFDGSVVSQLKVDGAVMASGAYTLIDGQSVTLELTFNASVDIGRIMSTNSGFAFVFGILGNIIVARLNGDVYYYKLNDIIDNGDATGTAPNSGNITGDLSVVGFDSADVTYAGSKTDGIWPIVPKRIAK